MKNIIFAALTTLVITSAFAAETAAKPDRSIAASGQYICDIKNLHTSESTYPYAQVRNYLNSKCDSDKPFSVTSGAPNSYLVCCVSK